MELENMKNAWQSMSREIEKKDIASDKDIERMMLGRFKSKLNKIGYSEYLGTAICYFGAAYLIVNFNRTEDTFIQIFALITIILLCILPVISLRSLQTIKTIRISSETYTEAIDNFIAGKTKFLRLQKINVSLGLFLLLTGLPVLAEIQGKNLNQISGFWTLIFPAAIALFLIFAVWVLRSYNKILKDTEKILSDINN